VPWANVQASPREQVPCSLKNLHSNVLYGVAPAGSTTGPGPGAGAEVLPTMPPLPPCGGASPPAEEGCGGAPGGAPFAGPLPGLPPGGKACVGGVIPPTVARWSSACPCA
jgi:hypothetical protein